MEISLDMPSLKIDEKNFSVLIVSETGGPTTRYRAFHKKEQLSLYGIRCDVIESVESINKSNVCDHDIFILHRLHYNNRVKKLLNIIQQLNKISIFDVDDLIFESRHTPWLKLIFSNLPNKADFYIPNIENFLRTLIECNYSFASTEFLADYIKGRGREVFVVRNALSKELIELSEQRSLGKNTAKNNKIILSYFSGTHTHDNDFNQIKEALIHVLHEYKNVNLQLVGRLTIDESFNIFKDRITQIPLVPWQELPRLIAATDVNLVPLDRNNPFCQAKSEIKYIEAAICGVPTIASNIGAYRYVINNGINGFLAATTEEWLKNLKLLIVRYDIRRQIGNNAREEVCVKYHPHNKGKELIEVLRKIITDKNAKEGPWAYPVKKDAYR